MLNHIQLKDTSLKSWLCEAEMTIGLTTEVF